MSFTKAQEAVAGYVSINHNMKFFKKRGMVVRNDFASIPDHQVRIISGGGCGHEPAHVGYIGKGLLEYPFLVQNNRLC